MPKAAAQNIAGKRSIRKEMPALYCGIENEHIAVNATTMTRIGLTIPACTAASPIMRPPTIPIAGPIGFGRRSPASRNISMAVSIISASSRDEKGTPTLVAIIEITNLVGIKPG
ncbi:hypothetical protein D3C85_1595800 [compost metagenome]